MSYRSVFFSFLLLCTSVSIFYSCKKDNSAIENTWWQVDQKQYQGNASAGVFLERDTATVFGAATDNKDALLLLFKKKPVAGRYYIVDTRIKTKAIDYADDECSMMIYDVLEKKSYWSFYHHEGVVDISLNGKKVIAKFSNVKLGLLDVNLDIYEVNASGSVQEK